MTTPGRLRRRVRWVGAGLATTALLLIPATPAAAQEEGAQEGGAQLAGATVRMELGDGAADTVQVSYQLAGAEEAGGTVTHQVLPRPGATIQEVRPGDGATAATLTDTGIDVTLADGADAYTLRYQVLREEGSHAVPLPVPSLPTQRGSQVEIRALLPPGQQLSGERMPAFSQAGAQDDRVALEHRSGDLPSAVLAEYGGGAGLSLGDWMTGAVLLAFAVTLIGWWIGTRHETSREAPA